MAAVYLFPLVGAFIADVLFGKYYTIIAFSLIYCLGHGALALDDTRLGFFAGLMLIAVGSGGIKPSFCLWPLPTSTKESSIFRMKK